MSRADKEGVLSRWSRRKLESARVTSETDEPAEQVLANPEGATGGAVDTGPPEIEGEVSGELPSLDELGPHSDFQGFMNPKVDDGLRRAALKKLFSDPHFNVTDGLDVYAEDYTKLETMTPAMVAGLKHAQRLLFGEAESDKQTDTARQSDMLHGPASDKATDDATLATYKEGREGGGGQGGNGKAVDGAAENLAELTPDEPEA